MISNKQLELLKFPYSDYDVLIAYGAIRSGKTIWMNVSYILWAMDTFNDCSFIIAGKTVKTAEKNIIKPIKALTYWEQNGYKLEYKNADNLLVVTRGNKKNYFYVYGGKDERSYELVQGLTAAGCLLDEVLLMPRSFVEQATARCSVEGSKMFFNCNPDSPNHWFYKEWILQPERHNALVLHFELDDNPSLSDKIKQRYRSMYSGVFYDRYIRGLFVNAEGSIYRCFSDNEEEHLIDEVPKDIMFVVAGVDFGGTTSSTTFVLTGFTRKMQNVVVLENKKIDWKDYGEIDADLLSKLWIEWAKMCHDKYNMWFSVYLDSAESVLISTLKTNSIKAKLGCVLEGARKEPIKDRIVTENKLFNQHRLKIMRHCLDMRNAFKDALWCEKKPNDSPDDEKRLDNGTYCVDMLDAFEYTIERYMEELDYYAVK
jgi:PBSX family phage terminase large subunit